MSALEDDLYEDLAFEAAEGESALEDEFEMEDYADTLEDEFEMGPTGLGTPAWAWWRIA